MEKKIKKKHKKKPPPPPFLLSGKFPNFVVASLNPHHQITYSCRKLPPPLSPRDWLHRTIYQKIDNDNYILIHSPVPNDDDPEMPRNFQATTSQTVVRGELTAEYELTRLPHGQTKVTFTFKVDLKGCIRKSLGSLAMSGLLDVVR